MGKGCIEAIYGLMGWKGLTMLKGVGWGGHNKFWGSFLCSSILTILNVVGGGGAVQKVSTL